MNKKIKAIDDKMQLNATQQTGSEVSSVEVEQMKSKISALEFALEDLRARNASKEELKEVKYVIDSINPLEFATLSQVRELIDKRMEELKKKS